MFDFNHPFFSPLWIRVSVVAVCTGWGMIELATGAPGWALIFLGVGGIAAYRFFVTFSPRGDD